MGMMTPFICGGWSPTTSTLKTCYTLENGKWKYDETASFKSARGYAATGSVIINNKLVFAGGKDNSKYLSTIEVAAPNTASKILPVKVPVAMWGSCIAPWDSSTIIVIGGYGPIGGSSRSETYLIDIEKNTVTKGPNLPKPRHHFGCHEMVLSGESYIVVVGASGQETSTFILPKSSYENGWQTSRDFDRRVCELR